MKIARRRFAPVVVAAAIVFGRMLRAAWRERAPMTTSPIRSAPRPIAILGGDAEHVADHISMRRELGTSDTAPLRAVIETMRAHIDLEESYLLAAQTVSAAAAAAR